MSWTVMEVRELKVGRYMVVDDDPCKIMSISTSKPGKHGEAKARIEAVSLFTGQKKSIVHPVKHKVQVPIIDKRNGQVLNVSGDEVEIMDMESYEQFSIPIADEFRDALEPGKDIQYTEALGRRFITKA